MFCDTNMSFMFYNAQAFNQYISKWNMSNVINMGCMFHYAYAFKMVYLHVLD